MQDFYATSTYGPLDQADGLRRLFSSTPRRLVALTSNPHARGCGAVLDHVAATLARLGRKVLVVDAAATAPAPHEWARLDLGAGVETVAEGVQYLPARGLPMAYVDTRGSASRFIDALADAAPGADLVLLHAEATDMTRLLGTRRVRPVVLGALEPEGIKHAYAAIKLLALRNQLLTFDLLMPPANAVRTPGPAPRAEAIVTSLAGCAESFLAAVMHEWAPVGPPSDADATARLEGLLAGQLQTQADPEMAALPAAPVVQASSFFR